MNELPDLGVGVMWFAGLDELIAASEPDIDFLEFEPAVSSVGGMRTAPSFPGKPLLVHGVTCAVGGSVAPDDKDMLEVAEVANAVGSPWVSEHLSVNRLRLGGGAVVDAGFLLPPAQTAESVAVAARNLRLFRERVGRPIAFETGVNYLRPQPGHLSDGEFFQAVAEAADCLILCDLHNLWCNERNGRDQVLDVIDALPVERVCEMHLAGGQEYKGFHLDAHSNTMDPQLVDLAVEVARRLPRLHAVTFELMPDYIRPNGIDEDAFQEQLERMRRIWEIRGQAHGPSTRLGPIAGSKGTTQPSSPADWDQDLSLALHGPAASASGPLATDPAVGVYRDLIGTMRMGNVVTALPLSYRLLTLTLGVEASDALLHRYLDQRPPCEWAQDEARQFRDFLAKGVTGCPHLGSVLDFELGAYEAVLTGQPVRVHFDHEPVRLIDSLRRCQRPERAKPGNYEVVIQP
jgi:uncharacterized protein